MNTLDYFSSIPSIDKNTNFWMVRAKRGFFFDEFLREEFIAIGFIAIFGGKIGQFEPNSLIGVVKDFINSKYEREKKAIELRKLKAETDSAEQEALSIKLENIKKSKELQLSMTDHYVEPLIDTAEKLQIQPSKSTILDITELLQKQSESSDHTT